AVLSTLPGGRQRLPACLARGRELERQPRRLLPRGLPLDQRPEGANKELTGSARKAVRRMGLLRELNKIRGGWPGGWKEFARGYGGKRDTPPFVKPEKPDDRRSLIPPLGLKEYWYPALPAKDIGWKKPVGLKIAGDELVFFRDKEGEVQALWDYCPHRGAYLSWGDCFWNGFVSCPYHGATFDG